MYIRALPPCRFNHICGSLRSQASSAQEDHRVLNKEAMRRIVYGGSKGGNEDALAPCLSALRRLTALGLGSARSGRPSVAQRKI